jgi:ribosomal protein S17E
MGGKGFCSDCTKIRSGLLVQHWGVFMGRIKGKNIKTAADKLVTGFSSEFSNDFDHNKAEIKKMNLLQGSKKNRMKLAGEITVLMKRRHPVPVVTTESEKTAEHDKA